MPNKKPNQKGFTLVELMISVAIIAILSTIGVAFFQNYSNRAGVRNSALELVSRLRKYQNYIISGQRNIMPGVTDACALPGNTFMTLRFTVDRAGWPTATSVSKIYSIVGCKVGASHTYTNYTMENYVPFPDQKVAQVTKIGYHYSGGQTATCQYAELAFTPPKNLVVQCGGASGSGTGIFDYIYFEFSKGASRYWAVVTPSGLVYDQKP